MHLLLEVAEKVIKLMHRLKREGPLTIRYLDRSPTLKIVGVAAHVRGQALCCPVGVVDVGVGSHIEEVAEARR